MPFYLLRWSLKGPVMIDDAGRNQRRMETAMFVFLAIVLFPLLSVVLVAGIGFVIWMQQLLLGPAPLI
jgi:nitrate reductase NapE